MVALPAAPPSGEALAWLAGHLACYRPDRLLVLSPQAPQTARAVHGQNAYPDAIAVLHQAYPCPTDLQLPQGRPSAGRTMTGGAPPCGCGDRHLSLVPAVNQLAPGWLSICTATPTAGLYPGAQGMNYARTRGRSVVVNGADLALVGETTTDGRGAVQTLWGLEVASFPAAPGTPRQAPRVGLGALEVDQFGVQPRTVLL